MARVLILSSWVAHGHVGLSAAAPVLQLLGHQVMQLPTILLSNHPGWPRAAGRPVPAEDLSAMFVALDANGWLAGLDAALVGYLPTADHVSFACTAIDRLRNLAPAIRIVVDPVLGDWPNGLYLPEPVAAAVRDRLVPLAGVLTPNRFELGWLANRPAETLDAACSAADRLRAGRALQRVLVTSPPVSPRETGVLCLHRDSTTLYRTRVQDNVPQGTGDVFAALVAAGIPVGAALGHLQSLVAASRGADHLRIAESAALWTKAPPLAASQYLPQTRS